MRFNGGINGLALNQLKLVSWVKTLVQHLSDILEWRINIGADLVLFLYFLGLIAFVKNFFFFSTGFRRHFITKGCTSFSGCSQNRWTVQQHCRRAGTAFYGMDDWTCVDCCQSDLCNYWVNFVCYRFSPLSLFKEYMIEYNRLIININYDYCELLKEK